jgi:hypothetical protein
MTRVGDAAGRFRIRDREPRHQVESALTMLVRSYVRRLSRDSALVPAAPAVPKTGLPATLTESRARVSRRWIMAGVRGRCGGRMIRGRWSHRSSGGGTSPPRKEPTCARSTTVLGRLLAAATTAVLVGGPAMVQAGITFNFVD